MEVYYNDPTLEPGDVLVLVEWLDSFSEEVSSWGAQDIPVFVDAKKRLLGKFDIACKVGGFGEVIGSRAWRSGSSAFWSVETCRWRATTAIC